VIGVDQFKNAVDPPQVFDPITLSPGYPYLSTVSMIAPSPDWFSGLDSFSPRGSGGYWYQTFEIVTYPFDAGTEEGTTYNIDNEASSPNGPIYQLTRDIVPDSGILLDPNGTTVLPVASWGCDLVVAAAAVPNSGGSPSGDFRVDRAEELSKVQGNGGPKFLR